MSYDVTLKDPETGKTILFDSPHYITGGTYCLEGTREAWLNITWNYGKHFRRVLGPEGIRTIYGMTGAESIPVLEDAIAKLGNDVTDNYWDSTEGNAKIALVGLLAFAKMRPDGVWDGD